MEPGTSFLSPYKEMSLQQLFISPLVLWVILGTHTNVKFV